MDLNALLADTHAWFMVRENALLVVALLLACWLWMLVRRRESDETDATTKAAQAKRLKRRPQPVSMTELGRLVYQAALSRDLHLYRDLYANGADAAKLMGPDAEAYLSARSSELLAHHLARLADALPEKGAFHGIDESDPGSPAVVYRSVDGVTGRLPIGHVAKVGALMRIVHPPGAAPEGTKGLRKTQSEG